VGLVLECEVGGLIVGADDLTRWDGLCVGRGMPNNGKGSLNENLFANQSSYNNT
jgi:hypothetical protein